MRSREIFEDIRKQKIRFSLPLRMTLIVTGELILAAGIGLGLYVLLCDLVPLEPAVLMVLLLLLTSTITGALATRFVFQWVYSPTKKLRIAMERVADGDFSVRLTDKSSAKEIMELYSGFNLMAHELGATEMLQSDFISTVSHEFKTPISAIEGYATLLQGGEHLSEEEQAYVEKIVFNTRRLSTLMAGVLLLSKLENQQIPTNRQSYWLDEQIRQSIVGLESAWGPKEIEFDAELDRLSYTGNETMMFHVWDNLLSNAIKYTPDCGTIRVSLRRREDQLVAAVEDDGPGIPPEAQKHIFDKFYQADSSHKEEGNGLGLALVKRILSLEGGSVCVENLPGCGCRFTVTLKA